MRPKADKSASLRNGNSPRLARQPSPAFTHLVRTELRDVLRGPLHSSSARRYSLGAKLLIDHVTGYVADRESVGPNPMSWSKREWESCVQSLKRFVFANSPSERTCVSNWHAVRYIIRRLGISAQLPHLIQLAEQRPGTEWRPIARRSRSHVAGKAEAHSAPPSVLKHKISTGILCGGRRFSTEFLAVLPEPKAHVFRNALEDLARSQRGHHRFKHAVAGIKQFLSFVLGSNVTKEKLRPASAIKAYLAAEKAMPEAATWEDALTAMRNHVLERDSGKMRSPKMKIDRLLYGIRITWPFLMRRGFPSGVEFPRVLGARTRQFRRRPTLAERIAPTQKLLKHQDEAIERLSSAVEPEDRQRFIDVARSCFAWLGPSCRTPTSVNDLVDLVTLANTEILKAVRAAAELEFQRLLARWEEGQRLTKLASHAAEELVELLDGIQYTRYQRDRNCHALLHAKTPAALANTLVYVRAVRRGFAIGSVGRISKALMFHGISTHDFQAYTHPTLELTTALALLIAVDTGANSVVIRRAGVDCLHAGTKSGYKRLTLGYKGSSDRYWDAELSDTPPPGALLSTPAAIEHYLRISAELRKLAPPETRPLLLLQGTGRGVKALTGERLNELLSAFFARHPRLRTIRATPAMLRGTFLVSLLKRFREGVSAAQLVAQHKSINTTEWHYLDTVARRTEHFESVRKFQDDFESITIVKRTEHTSIPGLTRSKLAHLLSASARTGFGPSCVDNLSGIQPGTLPGRPCYKLAHCLDCPNRYIVATEENIIDIVLVKHVLEHPPRPFAHACEPTTARWLTFVNVVIKKLERAGYAALLQKARSAAYSRYKQQRAIYAFLSQDDSACVQ